MLIVKLILTAILLLGVINPALSIRLSEAWKLNRKPPSEKVYRVTRIYSIIAIIIVWIFIR
ncbi:histidine kinase [Fusibacter bizertensis]|uniref:Histidine kinase n=1 Tax=Fusibacter bizertensis TaxID=1488331 RepID=A0ABT6NHC6_9FIRM|nr:histidine kinase [Fusibacter bizertensis]MDH8679835.1 histidine kinase [Fusibacter bizertensis]